MRENYVNCWNFERLESADVFFVDVHCSLSHSSQQYRFRSKIKHTKNCFFFNSPLRNQEKKFKMLSRCYHGNLGADKRLFIFHPRLESS